MNSTNRPVFTISLHSNKSYTLKTICTYISYCWTLNWEHETNNSNILLLGIAQANIIEDLLKEFVRDKFRDKEPSLRPQLFDESWYPSRRNIHNHIHMTSVRQKLSQIDQINLAEHIRKWESEDSDRKFFYRECSVPEEVLMKEQREKDQKSEKEDEDDSLNEAEMVYKVTQADINEKRNRFLYIHQDKWQQDLLMRYGNNVTLLDATYKTTKYNLPLFFPCVLTNHGYEIVGKEDSIFESWNLYGKSDKSNENKPELSWTPVWYENENENENENEMKNKMNK